MQAQPEYISPKEGIDAEIFVPPSQEAQFLVKYMPWLVAPADGQGSPLSRALRMVMVAPFTQLTFFSFDLQAFLFGVFHQSLVARIGHFVFMIGVCFFAMAGLHQYTFALGASTLSLGLLYAVLLAIWYTAVAASEKLPMWAAVNLAAVAALYVGADLYVEAFAESFGLWYYNPWVWMAISAVLIMLSHAGEEMLPPRVLPGDRWQIPVQYILGTSSESNSPATIVARATRVAGFMVWGTLDEWWAAHRLMAYNFLMLMLDMGYAPSLRRKLSDRVQRAVESRNPALDYVGIGGGTFLRSPEAEQS